MAKPTTSNSVVHLLDYGAGNVRSVINAIQTLGHTVRVIDRPDQFDEVQILIFPGVGSFGCAMEALEAKGLTVPLKSYLQSGRPFMGICIGMQVLFAGSDESPGHRGLAIFPAHVSKFDSQSKSVPHMGWNQAHAACGDDALVYLNQDGVMSTHYYFVHSYAVQFDADRDRDYACTLTRYGDQVFVSSVRWRNVFATQFHPEKSGYAGLALIQAFINQPPTLQDAPTTCAHADGQRIPDGFCKRIIACLDVRANDQGDLVVTKGDQYDVRERSSEHGQGQVRNLGKPVALAKRYFEEGADEVTFLNITSFRSCPLNDLPMLDVLKSTSETVFVPLTIGGGIKSFVEEETGRQRSALEVADAYFRSGADKVSIGSDAVYAAERYYERLAKGEKPLQGDTAIEQIAYKYGNQAVVISVDPKRVVVEHGSDTTHHTLTFKGAAEGKEQTVWYQCTVEGGRKGRDLDVIQLVKACEALGAGEILLNSMDQDGTNSGYDLALISSVKEAVSIPVIASSGAGKVEHFSQVFRETQVESALAAGIFHRQEVPIEAVKAHLQLFNVNVRKEGEMYRKLVGRQ